MKKFIIIFLAFSYLLLSTGVVVNLHYCMKQLASASFYHDNEKDCGKCGMTMHDTNGCCHSETQFLKINDDQQKTGDYSFLNLALNVTAPILSDYLLTPLIHIHPQKHFHNHSPPLLSLQDTYLKNNVFRI